MSVVRLAADGVWHKKPLQNAAACVASDIDIFEILAGRDGSALGTKELSSVTKANDVFLGEYKRSNM